MEIRHAALLVPDGLRLSDVRVSLSLSSAWAATPDLLDVDPRAVESGSSRVLNFRFGHPVHASHFEFRGQGRVQVIGEPVVQGATVSIRATAIRPGPVDLVLDPGKPGGTIDRVLVVFDSNTDLARSLANATLGVLVDPTLPRPSWTAVRQAARAFQDAFTELATLARPGPVTNSVREAIRHFRRAERLAGRPLGTFEVAGAEHLLARIASPLAGSDCHHSFTLLCFHIYWLVGEPLDQEAREKVKETVRAAGKIWRGCGLTFDLHEPIDEIQPIDVGLHVEGAPADQGAFQVGDTLADFLDERGNLKLHPGGEKDANNWKLVENPDTVRDITFGQLLRRMQQVIGNAPGAHDPAGCLQYFLIKFIVTDDDRSTSVGGLGRVSNISGFLVWQGSRPTESLAHEAGHNFGLAHPEELVVFIGNLMTADLSGTRIVDDARFATLEADEQKELGAGGKSQCTTACETIAKLSESPGGLTTTVVDTPVPTRDEETSRAVFEATGRAKEALAKILHILNGVPVAEHSEWDALRREIARLEEAAGRDAEAARDVQKDLLGADTELVQAADAEFQEIDRLRTEIATTREAVKNKFGFE